MTSNTARRYAKLVVLIACCLFQPIAWGQVPADVAQQLRQIGPVINPAATAAIYAPRVKESEPYRDIVVERDMAYGPAARNLLDVFVTPGGPSKPVLLFVHGGAFVAGNKKLSPTSPFYDNVGLWAARNGMVGITMTYRLAPQDPWPAGPEDIGRAVAWIHQNGGRFGADVSRIYILGHSTGASHVVAYLSHLEFQRVPGSGIAGVLLLSGIYQVTPELVAASPTYPGYFGSDSSRYPEQSSIRGLITSSMPLWVGSAELDPPTFHAQTDMLRASLTQAGRSFKGEDFPAHSHMSEVYSIYTDDTTVTNAILKFIPITP